MNYSDRNQGQRRATAIRFRGRRSSWVQMGACLVFLLLAAIDPALSHAQDAAEFFKQNCASCHTIGGGRLVGPDLKDVTKRKDRDWLTRFVLNPKAMIDRGDPYALQLKEESRGVIMQTILGITRERVVALLDLIEAESKLKKSHFAGLQVSDRPFTSEDVKMGRAFFMGTRPFKNGGPSCISCHTLRGIGGLSGGRLGPDLTKVFERIGGRKPLVAWLFGPATTTMKPVFSKHSLEPEEILPLVAYFEHTAQRGGSDNSTAPLNFLLLGLGGAALGMVLFDSAWAWRFRAVRRPLVHQKNERIQS